MNALSSWRRVVAVEQYNDSTDAKFSRTLHDRNPYTRSSVTPIHGMHEPAKRIQPHELALYGAYLIAVVALVLYA